MGLEDTGEEYEFVRFLRSREWSGPSSPPSIEEWRAERARAARSRAFRTARPLRPRVALKGLGRNGAR